MKAKRIAAFLTTALLFMGSVVVQAEDIRPMSTEDRTLDIYVSGKPAYTNSYYKDNSSNIYMYYWTGPSSCKVRAYGVSSYSGEPVQNCTYNNNAYVPRNDARGIKNTVIENGYDLVALQITSNQDSWYGNMGGEWSTDSTFPWTVADGQ